MMRHPLACVLLASCLGLLAPYAAAAPEPTLEVEALHVAFLEGSRIRVRGQLRCRHVEPKPEGLPHPNGCVEVNVEYPGADGGFQLLPDYFVGRTTDAPLGEALRPIGVYIRDGKHYEVGEEAQPIYRSSRLRHPPVLDHPLVPEKDEGRWIPFDRTLRFAGRAGPGATYRIVIGWQQDYIATYRFAHRYYWIVYGPFPWGEAPPCAKGLLARHRRAVTFGTEGVEEDEPAGDPPADLEPAASGEGDPGDEALPIPERAGGRPSQGEAADACTALEQRLGRWSRIAQAGARASPRVATLSVTTPPDVATDDLVPLAARVLVEAAAALSWVASVELTMRGTQGTSTVECSWDVIAAHARGKTPLAAFYDAWTRRGAALPAPPPESR